MASVLLYNLSGTSAMSPLRVLLVRAGLRSQTVAPVDFGKPLGQLLGLPDIPISAEADGAAFTDPMLVFCGLTDRQLDAFLKGMRDARIRIPCKAVLTETNVSWTSSQLHRELCAEHEAMQKRETNTEPSAK